MDTVRWLGFDWQDRLYYASDYFEQMYDYAEHLIKAGQAFVCDLTSEQVREYRGTLTEPGKDSPYRTRPVAENLDLFRRMRAGEFPDGARTLAGQDRHGLPQHQPAGPGDVPHPPCQTSPHRR